MYCVHIATIYTQYQGSFHMVSGKASQFGFKDLCNKKILRLLSFLICLDLDYILGIRFILCPRSKLGAVSPQAVTGLMWQ